MTRVRLFRQDDASAVAELIERMCAHFTAERLAQLAMERQVFVAEWDEVVGTVSRDGNKVFTMFVHPGAIGRGVGRRLIGHVEELAAADGFDHMETGASITGHGFYHRLGYVDVRTSDTEFGLNYILRKPLPRQGGPAESERSRRPLPT